MKKEKENSVPNLWLEMKYKNVLPFFLKAYNESL